MTITKKATTNIKSGSLNRPAAKDNEKTKKLTEKTVETLSEKKSSNEVEDKNLYWRKGFSGVGFLKNSFSKSRLDGAALLAEYAGVWSPYRDLTRKNKEKTEAQRSYGHHDEFLPKRVYDPNTKMFVSAWLAQKNRIMNYWETTANKSPHHYDLYELTRQAIEKEKHSHHYAAPSQMVKKPKGPPHPLGAFYEQSKTVKTTKAIKKSPRPMSHKPTI